FGPVANVSVLVLNQPAASITLTNTAGAFSITNVLPPYDLAILSPAFHQATIYRGLTRPDPTLSIEPNPNPEATASLVGTVAAGAGFPEGATTTSRLSLHNKGGFTGINRTPSSTDSSWSDTNYPWVGPSPIDVVLHVLEWTFDVNNHPVTFTRFGTATKTGVTPGAVLTGIDVPVSTVASTGTLSGTVTAPAGYNLPSVSIGVTFAPGFTGGPSIDAGDVLPIDGLSSLTNGQFSFHTPVIPNTDFVVFSASSDPFGFTSFNRKGLAANATGVNLVIPEHPTQLLPPNGGFASTGTLFAWTAPTQSVSRLRLFVPGFEVDVVQEASQLELPDLSEIGFSIPAGSPCGWVVDSFGTFSSIDDAAGPGGLRAPAAADEFLGSSNGANCTGSP
ncbi:MAG TPA: hypothetical protein VMV18_06940, partial [bacterium]|nr:hypothetical protein [bacterium]